MEHVFVGLGDVTGVKGGRHDGWIEGSWAGSMEVVCDGIV